MSRLTFNVPKIKICGITNLDDARSALECGADSLGFVFYEKSKRFVSPEKAKRIIFELRRDKKEYCRDFLSVERNVIITGVFVNESIETVTALMNNTDIDIIQLSGTESLEYIEELGIGKNAVLKAVHIEKEKDIEKISYYENAGVNVLVDTFAGRGIYGGTGSSFNLNLLKNINPKNLIIAGGIGPDNIKDIIQAIRPYGIDLSSKIEGIPGKKDYDKMVLFFRNLKGAAYEIAR
ncbi:MAG TPA: phosphoribosylanthranilate isomerase [bacterium]|nr:phosphoribosylanthranilate isomerase [bacterium]